MTHSTPDKATRELDRRTSEGISVRLLWNCVADEVVVAVHDTRSEDSLEVQVKPADALLAFRHPFAYAHHPPTGQSIAA
jgi:hypothetical protein